MRTLTPIGQVVTAILLSSCVSGGGSEDTSTRYDRNRISLEEIEAQPPGTAHQIVQVLRPTWLRGRALTYSSNTGRHDPVVFVDERPYGTLSGLYEISSQNIAEIVFISSSDATTRFGTGYPAGIIHIVLRK